MMSLTLVPWCPCHWHSQLYVISRIKMAIDIAKFMLLNFRSATSLVASLSKGFHWPILHLFCFVRLVWFRWVVILRVQEKTGGLYDRFNLGKDCCLVIAIVISHCCSDPVQETIKTVRLKQVKHCQGPICLHIEAMWALTPSLIQFICIIRFGWPCMSMLDFPGLSMLDYLDVT